MSIIKIEIFVLSKKFTIKKETIIWHLQASFFYNFFKKFNYLSIIVNFEKFKLKFLKKETGNSFIILEQGSAALFKWRANFHKKNCSRAALFGKKPLRAAFI